MELLRRLRVWVSIALATTAPVLAALFGVFTILAPRTALAVQTIPYKINFQGRLTDNNGNVLSDGSYNVKFRIFNVASGGASLWEEDWVYGSPDHRISVTNGLFNVQFGSITSLDPSVTSLFNSSTQLYLEVELPTPASATSASPVWTEGAMTPRQPLSSSPYAFNADMLDGLDSSAFGQLSAANTFTGANTFTPSSGVGIIVEAAAGTHSLNIEDASGAVEAYFGSTGKLNLSLPIAAPSTVNTINGLVITGGSLSNIGSLTMSGVFQNTFTTSSAASAQSLALSNTNTAAGVAVQGIDISPTNTATPTSGTNTLNTISFEAGSALGTGDVTNGLNFASSTGYSNFISTPTAVLTSGGSFTGLTGVALTTGNISTPGNISTTSSGNITSAGNVTVGAFASASSVPVCSNAGTLASCNGNPSGVTLQQAYAAGNTISTAGNDVAYTLNSGQNFTVATTAGATGSTTFSLATGTSSTAPAQLVLVKNNNTTQLLATGLSVQSAAGGITTGLDVSSANITNALAIGANAITGTHFSVTAAGAVTAVGVNTGTGALQTGGTNRIDSSGNLTNIGTISAASSATSGTSTTFNTTNSGASGTNTITSVGVNLTGSNTTGTNNITGLNFGSVTNPGGTNNFYGINFSSGYTSLVTYNGAGTVIINGSGQLNGAQIQAGSVANGALTNSSIGVTAGTGLTGGSSGISLGGTTSLSVDQTAALGWTGTEQFNKSGGIAVQLNGTSASGGAQLLFGGVSGLNGGSTSGTYIGANPASYAGDFLNFAINNTNKFKVDNTGNVTAAGTLNGATITGGSLSATGVDGVTATNIALLNGSQSFTGTNTFQPTTNIAGLMVKQNNSGSFGQDVFDVQGSSSGNFIQVTSTAANQGAVTVQSLGSNALTLQSGSGQVTLGSSSSLTASGALTLESTGANAATLGTQTSGANVQLSPNGTGVVLVAGTTPTIDSLLGTLNLATSNATAVNIGKTSSNILTTVDGTALVKTAAANSTTALQVQNSAATGIFTVDTSSNNSNNLLTNPSIETGGTPPSGWAAKGTATPTQVTSPAYDAGHSMQIIASAANAGVTQSFALAATTRYDLAVYVYSQNDFTDTTGNTGQFDMGFGTGGADTSCLSNQEVAASAWTRFTCSFETPASLTSPYIYFKQDDATSRTWFVDSAVLETDANATSIWQDGQITLNGTITSPLVVRPTTDSSNTLLVQNQNGIAVFGVDTTDSNVIANPGLEVNTAGWSYSGPQSNTTGIFRDTTSHYLGVGSLKLVMSATATDQARYTFSPNTVLQASTQYTLSFYAKDSATSYATLTFGRHENTTDTSCVTTGTITTSWQRFTCTFTLGATIGASPYVYISAGTASKTINIDAVSLEPGSTATPYGKASIYLNGVITSPTSFQNSSNSTAAFQIQNAGAVTLFAVDTTNAILNEGATGNVASASTINLATSSGAAQTVNIGSTSSTGSVGIQSGSGGINLGDDTGTEGINIGGVTNTGVHPVHIGTNASDTGAIAIGNSASSTAVTIDAGNTGLLQIGNSTAAHTIQIGAGGTAAGSVESITIGSASTTSASKVTLQGGSISTTNNSSGIVLGNGFSTSATTLIPLTLSSDSNFSSDESTSNCSATVNQGSLYYNSSSDAIRGCINGAWEDVVTTSGLGVILFGVVPDSSTTAGVGDLAGAGASGTVDTSSGPCKVYVGSAAKTIRWTGCVAYSGGRKIIVTPQTADLTLTTSASTWAHVCLTGTGNQPAVSAFGAENADLPTFSANNPVLCLADISTGTGQANITGIYDTRTFTTSIHTFAQAITTGLALGVPVIPNGANVQQVGASATANIQGVVVASHGDTSGTPNVILAVGGPVWVKATAGSAGSVVITSTTAGRVTTGASVAGPYGDLGLARTTFNSTCTANIGINCQSSLFFDFFPR